MMATRATAEHIIKRFGLTEVYAATSNTQVDVVFIHGLHGNPQDTWSSTSSEAIWPATLLGPILQEENACILVYGYAAQVASFTDGVSNDKIHDHAEQLVAELATNRRVRRATEHPIIFVAHSLGGLVVKRALIHSSDISGTKTEHLRSIFVSTYGILFLGTPRKGLNATNWRAQLEAICQVALPEESGCESPQLINILKSNNETLQNIDRQFIQLTRSLHMFFFHEGIPTHLEGGRWEYIVNEESASPTIQDVERAVIQKDHIHMCKFENSEEPGFRLVTEAIQRYTSDAAGTIGPRWDLEKADRLAKRRAEAEELLRTSTSGRFSARPDSRLQPSFPSLSNSFPDTPLHYVERGEPLKSLNSAFAEPDVNEGASRIVLVHGLPGSGFKEFAVDAGILELRKSSQLNDPDVAIDAYSRYPASVVVEKVKQYIKSFPEKWLFVYDNYGDDEFPIRPCFPQSQHGHVIVISRTRKFSNSTGGKAVLVGPMSMDEAVCLLRRSTDLKRGDMDAPVEQVERDIISQLGCLPLAIAQASAMIRNDPSDGLGMVERLRKYELQYKERAAAMLDDDESRVQEYEKSVITTFDDLFEHVLQRSRLAAELLLLLGFLHHTNIPRELFRTVYHALDKLSMPWGLDMSEENYSWVRQIFSTTSGGEWDSKTFDDAMGLLDRYSLVRNVGGSKYNIHPLVHSWTRVSKICLRTTSLEARAQLAIAMLTKTHDTKLDRFSGQSRKLRGLFNNHVESCIRSTQRYTKLLDPYGAATLQASTILAINGMLQCNSLSRQHKEQQLLPKINLLALINGSHLAGLDDISTLNALRVVVAELPEILPESTVLVQDLFKMGFKLLPIATSKDQASDLPRAHLGWLVGQIIMFGRTQNPQGFDAGVQGAIAYANCHRDDIDEASYFRFKSVVFGLPKPPGSDSPETLSLIDEYLVECDKHFGSSQYYATNATVGKAMYLCGLGKLHEAEEIFRSIIEADRGEPEKRNLVLQALTGLRLVLYLQNSARSEIMQTASATLKLETEDHGSFHEAVLQMKLLLLDGEAEEKPNRLNQNYASRLDGGDGMNDDFINTALKLAIIYKSFERQEEIPVLWEGVMTQARLEIVTEDIIPSYVLAFKAARDAGVRQGYRHHASVLNKVVAALEHPVVKHRRFEPRIDELLRLKQLWDLLVILEEKTRTVKYHDKGYSSGQEVLNFIQDASREARPAMLFLVIKYVEWMLSVEFTHTVSPMSPNIMARLRTLASGQFGEWNNITMRAMVNLAVCYRLSDNMHEALGIENELVEKCIQECMHVSQQSSFPGYNGIERLLAEHRSRDWHVEAIRVIKAINGPLVQRLSNYDVNAMHYYCSLCGFYQRAGVQIEATEGAAILLASAYNGEEAVVRILLDSGIDIEAKNDSVWTALHFAARYGGETVVRFLLERGANKEERTDKGSTALHLATAKRGNAGMLKLLLENGFDIDARDNDERTALHEAACRGHWLLVQYLLEQGANINAKTSDGATTLHIVAASTEEGNKATLLLLLERGIEIEAKRAKDWTALHESAARADAELMQVLLEKGANIWAKTDQGGTVLFVAALCGNYAGVRLLLEKRLDVDAKADNGISVLQAGAVGGSKAVVQLLLDRKSDDGLRIGEMWTAMGVAHAEEHMGVMMLILKNYGYRALQRVILCFRAYAIYICVSFLLILSSLFRKV